jgi:hypothetical protein
MSVTISIELTDEQWEVVKEYYPGFMKDVEGEVLTPENLSLYLLRGIKNFVANDIGLRRADESLLSVFD